MYHHSHRDASDLYKIYIGKAPNLSQSKSSLTSQTAVNPGVSSTSSRQRSAAAPNAVSASSQGALSRLLSDQREARAAILRQKPDSRHSRFCGQYTSNRFPLGPLPMPESSAGNLTGKIMLPPRAPIVSNPFAEVHRPDGNRRNEKKSSAFSMVSLFFLFCF
jgi:hypothetical protein